MGGGVRSRELACNLHNEIFKSAWISLAEKRICFRNRRAKVGFSTELPFPMTEHVLFATLGLF